MTKLRGRFPAASLEDIVSAMLNNNGHAGKASNQLRKVHPDMGLAAPVGAAVDVCDTSTDGLDGKIAKLYEYGEMRDPRMLRVALEKAGGDVAGARRLFEMSTYGDAIALSSSGRPLSRRVIAAPSATLAPADAPPTAIRSVSSPQSRPLSASHSRTATISSTGSGKLCSGTCT